MFPRNRRSICRSSVDELHEVWFVDDLPVRRVHYSSTKIVSTELTAITTMRAMHAVQRLHPYTSGHTKWQPGRRSVPKKQKIENKKRTLLELQSRFGDKLLRIRVAYPLHETAILKGLRKNIYYVRYIFRW